MSSTRRKLALIIGNGAYQSKNKLAHSSNNANDLGTVLQKIGFTVRKICDANKTVMTDEIIGFAEKITDGDLVLFYFSGHVYSVDRQTYLLPTNDANIEIESDFEDFGIHFERQVKRLTDKNRSYLTLFLLDNYSSYNLTNAKSERKTFFDMRPPPETFILFACGSETTKFVPKHTDRNSLFTKHLLQDISKENLPVITLLQTIKHGVYQESNQQQTLLSFDGLKEHKQASLNEVIPPPIRTSDFLTNEPLSQEEYNYFENCKEYYRSTGKPLVSIDEQAFNSGNRITSLTIKLGIEENCHNFNLQNFLASFCDKTQLSMDEIAVKKIQKGSVIMTISVLAKNNNTSRLGQINLAFKSNTEQLSKELGTMKMFFMFLGREETLGKMQRDRVEIRMNPEFNRIYGPGHNFWEGAISDGKNRGTPYYCPVGWRRWSFFVTDNFNQKFDGWCICYHGTKYEFGLSILLGGLKPAYRNEHGDGLYLTPSINYASHPRYAEVKRLSVEDRRLIKTGEYIQYVLECRVRLDSILKSTWETLQCQTRIDPNIPNQQVEWVINNYKKDIVDFNDPDSPIVCTGLMIRITDSHPALLPESQWWFDSHLCDDKRCCRLGIDKATLEQQKRNGQRCRILLD